MNENKSTETIRFTARVVPFNNKEVGPVGRHAHAVAVLAILAVLFVCQAATRAALAAGRHGLAHATMLATFAVLPVYTSLLLPALLVATNAKMRAKGRRAVKEAFQVA